MTQLFQSLIRWIQRRQYQAPTAWEFDRKKLKREKHESMTLTKFLFTSELENKFANFEQEFLYIEGRLFNHKAENMICSSYTLRTPKNSIKFAKKTLRRFYSHIVVGIVSEMKKYAFLLHFATFSTWLSIHLALGLISFGQSFWTKREVWPSYPHGQKILYRNRKLTAFLTYCDHFNQISVAI